jgi:hypothetical protein
LQVLENHSYLDQATQGESSPWRYLAGTFSILFIWLIIGGIATTFLLVFLGIYQGLSFSEITQSIFEPERSCLAFCFSISAPGLQSG